MSKSRLEKFLYALYSLDSSDLPSPLSRIEELYKCWVTGEEAPTFEPLSRVEKYLMAILGVYDVNELPNPISRVEVLLYKLAIGDDNLDDIKSFLSEHEELLAEIIRNGCAGGNIVIEYVSYTLSTEHNTLYNTAEKPVKSAILKGNTIKKIGLESGSYNGYLEKIPMNNRLRTTELVNGYDIIRIDCKDGYQAYIRGNGKDSSWNQSLSITFKPEQSFAVLFKKNDDSVFSQSDYGDIIEYTNIAEISDNNGNELVSVKMPVLTTSNEDGTKTNILTVNEDVTLCSNGDVYDELNLLTGRLTQRIDENNEVLSQEVVKTVDLSVVDQDGNDTELSTFDDLTHVTLSSEGLTPEAELEVATKNEEVLSTLSLEMDDISATQTTLGGTVNAQSENVDATMFATTEIYEELL